MDANAPAKDATPGSSQGSGSETPIYRPWPIAMRIHARSDNFRVFLRRQGVGWDVERDVNARNYIQRAKRKFARGSKKKRAEELLWRWERRRVLAERAGKPPPDDERPPEPEDEPLPPQTQDADLPKTPLVYSPLPHPDSIRILVLEPGEPSVKMVFHMQHERLSERPEAYTALSYVWGSGGSTVDIFSREGTLSVTPNLSDALRRLRLTDEPRRVWVDAACINQADDVERARQVRLMGDIYRWAKSVAIWLGPDEGDQALAAFCALSGVASVGSIDGRPVGNAYFFGRDTLYTGWAPLSLDDASACSAVAALFSQPWFQRIWCVQEVALARHAVVLWGDFEMAWKWLGLAAARLRFNYSATQLGDGVEGISNAYLAYRISRGHDVHVTPHTPSFFQLLSMTRRFESTDPRDRIYGLLGLPTTDTDPKKGSLFLDPDYSLSVDSVYQQLAERVIQAGNLAGLLCAVQHGAEITASPPWIPQWDKYHTSPINTNFTIVDAPPAEATLMKDHLIVRGSHLSTISSVSPAITPSPTGGGIFEVLNSHQTAALHALLRDPEKHAMLSSTLTAGKTWHGGDMGPDDQDNHIADFAAFAREQQDPRWRDSFPTDLYSEEGHAGQFWEAMCWACAGKRFLFDDGGRLGLAPVAARKGDWVCRVAGGSVPLVLRPQDGHVLLVGECYVHEYMGGDGMAIVERTFEIR